jgi:hypothetical protein
MLFENFKADVVNKKFELRSYWFLKNTAWANEEIFEAQNSILLEVGVGGSSGFTTFNTNKVFCNLIGGGTQGAYRAQPLQQEWDLTKAKSWVETCLQCHSSICKQELYNVPGMNLIDCDSMAVVKADKTCKWLALSYVWGSSQQRLGPAAISSFRNGSGLDSNMGGTIQDAIIVTKKLGYRYLWVDEYCIDQDNESHKSAQISKMDMIYRGADLTIVAAAGKDKAYGLPGVGSTKRTGKKSIIFDGVVIFTHGPGPSTEAQQSDWFTRAW